MRCDQCRWWEYCDSADEEESDDENGSVGTCKRFPPVRVMPKLHFDEACRAYQWDQPFTTNTSYCGEFTPSTQADQTKA